MFEQPTWLTDAHSNLVSLLVLEIIRKNTSYGYQIKKTVEYYMNEVYINYEFKISSLYTLLKRLERENLIESFKDSENAENERDKNRTFYKMTNDGNILLDKAWKEWNSLLIITKRINEQLGV